MKNCYLYIAVYCFCFLSILAGCQRNKQTNNNQKNKPAPIGTRISLPNQSASCPYLTKDNNGNVVLGWVQAQDTAGNYLLAYAVSVDGGKSFGAPKTIPTTKGIYPHDENLSKILFRKNGDMVAMFAVSNPSKENSYAGLVFYTQSFDSGQTWTAPRQLASNAVNSIDERYFDMALLPDGEIAAIWLDSRKETDQEGSSLYFARTQGRAGFLNEKVIDKHLCQCCRTALYVDGQGKLHAAYRAILNDSIRDMMHLVSADNGQTFSRPERISPDNWVIRGCPHTGPTMTSNEQGMHFAWYTMGRGSGVYYSQQPTGQSFLPRETVSNVASAKHPQMATYSNGKIAIVWNEQVHSGSKISLQTRDAAGKFLQHISLTLDTTTFTHPVLVNVANSKILVAYTKKIKDTNEVWYQMVSLQP